LKKNQNLSSTYSSPPLGAHTIRSATNTMEEFRRIPAAPLEQGNEGHHRAVRVTEYGSASHCALGFAIFRSTCDRLHLHRQRLCSNVSKGRLAASLLAPLIRTVSIAGLSSPSSIRPVSPPLVNNKICSSPLTDVFKTVLCSGRLCRRKIVGRTGRWWCRSQSWPQERSSFLLLQWIVLVRSTAPA
jgi:hypothetical protein